MRILFLHMARLHHLFSGESFYFQLVTLILYLQSSELSFTVLSSAGSLASVLLELTLELLNLVLHVLSLLHEIDILRIEFFSFISLQL